MKSVARKLNDIVRAWLPGWLGQPFDSGVLDLPTGRDTFPGQPMYLRLDDAHPIQDIAFPAVTPFLGGGHPGHRVPAHGRRGGVGAARHPDLAGLSSALDEAEQQISAVLSRESPDPPVLVLAAALPSGVGRTEWARLSAIAHAGPAARVHLLIAGYPPPHLHGRAAPRFENTTWLASAGNGWYRMSQPPCPHALSTDGSDLPAVLALGAGANEDLVAQVCHRSAATAAAARQTDFSSLLPARIWQEWCRIARRIADAVGGSAGREDVAWETIRRAGRPAKEFRLARADRSVPPPPRHTVHRYLSVVKTSVTTMVKYFGTYGDQRGRAEEAVHDRGHR